MVEEAIESCRSGSHGWSEKRYYSTRRSPEFASEFDDAKMGEKLLTEALHARLGRWGVGFFVIRSLRQSDFSEDDMCIWFRIARLPRRYYKASA
jgi:hypothetical protein